MRTGVPLALLALLGLVGCGDDTAADPSPAESEAIASIIDAEINDDEERCLLAGLDESGVGAESVIDGTLEGDDDAGVFALAVACVDDLAEIPAFVQVFIDSAAAEGVTLTEPEARCAIDTLREVDAETAIARCVDLDDAGSSDTPDEAYLALLTEACEGGNNQACDELYEVAPDDSAELEVGRTCAGRLPDSIGLRCFLDLDG
jgi:hypothetical protein